MVNRSLRLYVEGVPYVLNLESSNLEEVEQKVVTALVKGEVVPIDVRDDRDRPMTLYLNGGKVPAVLFDRGAEPPRPHEISGGPQPK